MVKATIVLFARIGLVIGVIVLLLRLFDSMGMQFVHGCLFTAVIFHLGYRAKYGNWIEW